MQMKRTKVAIGVAVIAVVAISAGCGTGNEQSASESAQPDSAPAGSAQSGTDITLTTNPDPVRTGDNTFEVVVMQKGEPVTDATVSTEFYMAAMPSMKMPEMRTKTDLTHVANGMYRGNGQVTMAGNWDVTVTVMRGGQEIGSKKVTVTAK
jgi:hypothetical protein